MTSNELAITKYRKVTIRPFLTEDDGIRYSFYAAGAPHSARTITEAHRIIDAL